MFRRGGAIFRYVQVLLYNHLCFATFPTLASGHTLGVRGVYVLFVLPFCQMYYLQEI
jgi:hypothetical protein